MTPPNSEGEYQACLDKAFLLLSIRMQTEHELWEKLGKKFARKDVGTVISRLKELGYVDDRKFAALWVESRGKNHGPNALRAELIKKGLRRELINSTVGSLTKEQQIAAAKDVIRVKDKLGMDREERFKKLGSLLARRGYDYEVIKKALETTPE